MWCEEFKKIGDMAEIYECTNVGGKTDKSTDQWDAVLQVCRLQAQRSRMIETIDSRCCFSSEVNEHKQGNCLHKLKLDIIVVKLDILVVLSLLHLRSKTETIALKPLKANQIMVMVDALIREELNEDVMKMEAETGDVRAMKDRDDFPSGGRGERRWDYMKVFKVPAKIMRI